MSSHYTFTAATDYRAFSVSSEPFKTETEISKMYEDVGARIDASYAELSAKIAALKARFS